MRRFGVLLVIGVVVAGTAIGFAVSQLGSANQYSTVLPNAINLVVGSPVQVRGFDVGEISSLEVRDNQALVKMKLDKLPEPLHEGTTANVGWAGVLGHRFIELRPGPADKPVLADGAILPAGSHQVLLEELLEALNPETRTHLRGMLQQLDTTLQGSQPDFNRTLKEAGPTVEALGAVLNGVGADGQSIKTLLANLHKVTEVLAQRKSGISSTVVDLNRMTTAAAVHQQALSDGLAQLPGTLDAAKETLDKVPPATDATVPLLEDLRPAADRLPSVADNLRHVMKDLRPALKDLPPTLEDADRLFEIAPAFFDEATPTLGQLTKTVQPEYAGNAVRFLRPYTPELIGWLGNWGNAFASYDSGGTIGNVLIIGAPTSVLAEPDIVPPGYWPQRHLPPGINAHQPWEDANAWADASGSEPR